MKIHHPHLKARARYQTPEDKAAAASAATTRPTVVKMTNKTKPKPDYTPLPRLVPRESGQALSAIPVGRHDSPLQDMYVRLIDAPWRRLIILIAIAYCSLNTIFALLYSQDPHAILNARPDSFVDAFFFSVQTFATIGYGQMAPHTIYANILVAIEAFMGMAFYAMITGLVFAKFSRPTARVLFSNVAVVAPYKGCPHLMLRLANQRLNRIINASLQAVLLIEEISEDGQRMRRFIDIPLVRSQVPFMLLTWTVMHKIDEHSPFHKKRVDELRNRSAELIISLTGLDESLAQTIHTRFSYLADEVKFNHVFEDVLTRREDGKVEIHYDKFHDIRPYHDAKFDAIPGVASSPDQIPAEQLPIEQPADKNAKPLPRVEEDIAFIAFDRTHPHD